MNESDRQARIAQLHNKRHALLQQRKQRGASILSVDMELNVVRSELQALYEAGRIQPRHQRGPSAAVLQIGGV